MNQKQILFVLSFLPFIFPILTFATELKVAGIFGHNAVLQQAKQIPIWGTAAPGSQITVALGKIVQRGTTDSQGNWKIYLPPQKASYTAYELKISDAEQQIVFKNIKIGEVWLASGQSNMEYSIRAGVLNTQEEIAHADWPDIRFFYPQQQPSPTPLKDIPNRNWMICTPQNAPRFSAVAYFFAKELHLDRKVPVGIIVSARGATGIDTWMSRESLLDNERYGNEVKNFDPEQWRKRAQQALVDTRIRDSIAKYSMRGLELGVINFAFNDSQWRSSNFPFDLATMKYGGYWGIIWTRKPIQIENPTGKWTLSLPIHCTRANIYLNGQEVARKETNNFQQMKIELPDGLLQKGENLLAIRMYVAWGIGSIGSKANPICNLSSDRGQTITLNGEWHHSNQIEPTVPTFSTYYKEPCLNFNSAIYPLIGYSLRGFLWYQGEGNTAYPGKEYITLQSRMIYDWRKRWDDAKLPFLYVQLANYLQTSDQPKEHDNWAELRDAQRAILDIVPQTGMAVTIDIGEWDNVHPKNKQEVGRRLYLCAQNIAYQEHVIHTGPTFANAIVKGDKMYIKFAHQGKSLHLSKGNKVEGFAVRDKNGTWYWTDGEISGNKVILTLPTICHQPDRVQYAWQANPITNLYGDNDLPAVPFNEKIQ